MNIGMESYMELEWMLRIVCSGILGMIIGLERHNKSKEAGVRTHAIVALSAALITVVSKYGFMDVGPSDPARVAAQLVTGIGFLGAGIIFIKNDSVLGLTTAAGIWATAAVGLCIGAGYYVMGISTSALILIVQLIARRLFTFSSPRTFFTLDIKIDSLNSSGTIKSISDYCKHAGLVQSENKIYRSENLAENNIWGLQTELVTVHEVDPLSVVKDLNKLPGVTSVELI